MPPAYKLKADFSNGRSGFSNWVAPAHVDPEYTAINDD